MVFHVGMLDGRQSLILLLNWCFRRNETLESVSGFNAAIQGLMLRPEENVQINVYVYVHLNCQGAVLQCLYSAGAQDKL